MDHNLSASDIQPRSPYRDRTGAVRHRSRGSSGRWAMTATWREPDARRQPVAGPPHRPGSGRTLPTSRLGPVSESPTIRSEQVNEHRRTCSGKCECLQFGSLLSDASIQHRSVPRYHSVMEGLINNNVSLNGRDIGECIYCGERNGELATPLRDRSVPEKSASASAKK